MDIKKRQQIKQNFIEYRPDAFKEASARIQTARVRENQNLLRLNEEDGDDIILEDNKHMMSSISSPKNNEGDASMIKKQTNKKVIMHVNKFVPFYMQYHQLSSEDLSNFAKDY